LIRTIEVGVSLNQIQQKEKMMSRADFKTNKEIDLGIESFVDPTTKVPIAIGIDISQSMSWHGGIDAAYEGVKVFLDTLKQDSYASACVEVAIFTFNHKVKKVVDFAPVNEIVAPTFTAEGTTDMNSVVVQMINELDTKQRDYKSKNIKSKVPWLVLLSDADVVDSSIDEAVEITSSRVAKKALTLFSIATGNEVNIEQFKRFNPTKPVIYSPTNDSLVDLFEWLSQTAIGFSETKIGESSKSEPLDRRYDLF